MDKTTILENNNHVNARPDRQTIANILNFSKAYRHEKTKSGIEIELIQN
ncbi:MAG: hypothetical protein NXI09_11145 [Bacteroidetes bacterium]|nr:hypothetical protein [Bacteroidota bacterium]